MIKSTAKPVFKVTVSADHTGCDVGDPRCNGTCNRSDGDTIRSDQDYIVTVENTFRFDDCPDPMNPEYLSVSYQFNRDPIITLGPGQDGYYTKTSNEPETLAVSWSWSGPAGADETRDIPLGSVTLTLTKTGKK